MGTRCRTTACTRANHSLDHWRNHHRCGRQLCDCSTAFAAHLVRTTLPESLVHHLCGSQRRIKLRESQSQDSSSSQPHGVGSRWRRAHQVQCFTRARDTNIEGRNIIKGAPHLCLATEGLQKWRVFHDGACEHWGNSNGWLCWIRCQYGPIAGTSINSAHYPIEAAEHHLIEFKALTRMDSHDADTLTRRSAHATRFNTADKVTWPCNIGGIRVMGHGGKLAQTLQVAGGTNRSQALNGLVNPSWQAIRMQCATHLC